MSRAPHLPHPLKRGDTIGIIAPAGQIVDRHRFEAGLSILTEMGFEVRFPRDMWPGEGYLADSDRNRAEELHSLLADSDIKGLMAARGGYGCLRLLNYLDYSLFARHRKMLVGFSDISILLNVCANMAGLLCFHGPVVTSLIDTSREGLERLYGCMTGNWQRAISPSGLEVLRGEETIRGQLVGGNLSSLMTLVGTRYDQSWRGRILLLEDIGEQVYRIDRLLTHLSLTGKLEEVAGILLGDFTFDHGQDFLEKVRYREYVWRRVLEITQAAGVAVWANIPSGHLQENLTLPLGATVEMDPKRGELRFV